MQREVELEGADKSHREVGNDVVEAVPAVKLQTKAGPQSAGSHSRFFGSHEDKLRHGTTMAARQPPETVLSHCTIFPQIRLFTSLGTPDPSLSLKPDLVYCLKPIQKRI